MSKAPWLKVSQQEPLNGVSWPLDRRRGPGLNIQGHVRDLIMSELNVPIQKAQEVADKFAEMVESSQWLELSNGMATWRRKETFQEQPSMNPEI